MGMTNSSWQVDMSIPVLWRKRPESLFITTQWWVWTSLLKGLLKRLRQSAVVFSLVKCCFLAGTSTKKFKVTMLNFGTPFCRDSRRKRGGCCLAKKVINLVHRRHQRPGAHSCVQRRPISDSRRIESVDEHRIIGLQWQTSSALMKMVLRIIWVFIKWIVTVKSSRFYSPFQIFIF